MDLSFGSLCSSAFCHVANGAASLCDERKFVMRHLFVRCSFFLFFFSHISNGLREVLNVTRTQALYGERENRRSKTWGGGRSEHGPEEYEPKARGDEGNGRGL